MMFTVDRAKLEQAESNGSLLANIWPPGFEVEGRRVLEECDEMTLYELYRPGGEQVVVLDPEIERIFLRFLFRINDTYDAEGWERKDRDRRFSLAVAMKRLHNSPCSGIAKARRAERSKWHKLLPEALARKLKGCSTQTT